MTKLDTAVLITKGACLMATTFSGALCSSMPDNLPPIVWGITPKMMIGATGAAAGTLLGFLSTSFASYKSGVDNPVNRANTPTP